MQGNPTSYLGHTLVWEKGRQLKSYDNITYTYNANGIRTGKTVGDISHSYYLEGTKIVRETWGRIKEKYDLRFYNCSLSPYGDSRKHVLSIDSFLKRLKDNNKTPSFIIGVKYKKYWW